MCLRFPSTGIKDPTTPGPRLLSSSYNSTYVVWWEIQRKVKAILLQESGILLEGGNNNQEADKL